MPYAFSRMSDSDMREGMRTCPGEGEEEAFGGGEGNVDDGGLEEDAPGEGRGECRQLGQDGIMCLRWH